MTEQPNNQQGAYNGQPYNSPAPNLNPYEKYQLLKSNNFQAPPGTQKIWTQQSNLNRNLTFWKPDAQARFRPDLPPAVWDNSKQYQGYWGDPKRVVDAYNFLRVQDDDYVPPSYLDPEFVNDMYKQLKTFNSGNDDPYRWEPLPFGHEASYYAYVQPGADFWENTPGNRFELSVPRQRLDLAGTIEAMSKIVDEVNATLAESYEAGQISRDEYDQSVKWFSQYALSPEARAAVADGTLSAETLAGAFDPRDYTQLAVSDLLEKQGILDLNGQPATDYKDMETWQQALLTVFGAPEGMNLPKVQKQVAPVLGAGMSAMGVFGAITTSALLAAKISAPIAGAITVATGGGGVALAPIVMAAAAVVGGFAGWKQYQASISGQENDVSKVTTFLFNVLAEGTERSIGTATIMSEVNQFVNEAEAKGMTEPEVNQAVLERYGVSPEGFWDLFSQAWSASRLQYESAGGQGAGDWFADTVSTAVHAFVPEWSTGTTTAPGQVWQLQNGMTSPTNLGLNSTETRAAIMRDFASLGDNPSKEDRDALAAMWSDALGFSGNMNEFTGQIFLDPLNFVPAAVNKSVDIYATKKFNLATAADDMVASKKYANLSAAAKQGIGNPIIDALPFGFQQGVEWAGKLLTNFTKGADASVPRWLRGSMNPAQVFNYASALDNQGISQQTFLSAYDDLRQRGYNAPTGFAIDITAAVEAGNLSPYGRMFMSGDGLSATVQLFDPNGRSYSTETFYAADKTPFRSPSEAMDRLKVIVNEPGYSGTEKSKINKFLDSPLEMTQKSRLGMVDYMKDLKADSSPITAAVTNPSIINPETGEVMAQGKLVLDSIDETHKTYRVESPDGLTQYTVDMESDKVITMTVNGRVELIPADGYLVTPGRNVDMADPNLTRINMQAANDMATAFGLEKPYVESIYSEGAKPDSAAVATQLTGNKFVDYFIKLADYTPEAKITITNRAITETILGATLLGKNDPDKFFAFFDYLSGRPVEVSQQMKDFALGGTVATAMLTLKDALKEGSAFYTLRKNWDISTIRRVEIQNLARAIGVEINKIPTIRLDEITAKLDAYNRKAANDGTSPQIEMTAAEIKKFISPFQGSDALPLTKEALVSSAIFAVIADSERAAIKMYDPQTKSTLGQLSALAKSIIGLPLISANPATWVMNMFNNWVTMNVMVGTGGTLITGDALAKSQARFGVDYTTLIGSEFKVADVISSATAEYNKIMNPDNWITDARHFIAGLSSSEVTPLDNLARAAGVKPEDLLIMSTGDIQKAITSRAGARKFKKQTRGFETISLKQIESKLAPFIGDDAKPLTHSKFNPLSTYGKIEQFFAIRTMHMAIEQAMAAPLSDIRPELRNELIAAGMTDKQLKAFQAAANKAYNLQEIESFYKNGEIVYNPVPDEIIGIALDRMAEGDPGKRAAIETLLDFNGLRDDLTEAFSKPRTPDEMNAIKHDLYQRLRTAANQTRVNNLAGEFSKVTEDTAGHIGLLKNLYSISTQEYQTLFDANREFGTYWGLIDDATKNDMGTREFNAYKANLWAFYSDRVKAMWEDTRTVMLNGITAGMVKAGVGEDGDFFVANLRQRLTLMEGVFKEISQINQDAYDGVLPKGTDTNKLIRDVYKKYGVARDGNQKAWVDHIIEMFDRDGTPPTGKTKEATHNSLVGFMGEFLKRDRKFRNDVLGHRDSIKNMNYEARRAANRAFYEQTYQPQALDILKFLTNDAYEEFNTIRPSKHSSKGQGQTKATKTQPSTLIETDLASRRAELARNSTVLEHQAMVDAQTRAAYGTYNKMTFQNEINAATNLTSDAQRASVSAYFDAFDDSVKRLTGGKFGFYDSLGAIEAFDTDRLPQDKFPSPDGEGYVAAMTYGDDGKFVLNFATNAADMSSVFHEGSHAIVDTARRMYDMGVFPGYETILADAGHTTVEAFNAMDNAAKGKVYDDIADSMFKWQSDIEVAKAMPTKLQAAFRVMSDFFTDLINRLMARYKDVELTPAVKEVYRSLFTQSELAAKADRNAVRISKFREGKTFTVYGADNSRIYNLIPVVVEADTLRPSHDLGGHQNPDFPQKYQPREYKLSFVRERAAKLTPDLLLKQPVDLANGAPIIDEFGNVVAGNHRIGFLNEARDSFPEQWAKYQQALPENLAQYGLTDADLKDMTNPVLVYKVADDADTMNIVTDANTPNQQQMSALELANLYAPHLDNNLISKIEFREGKTVDDVIRSESVDDLRRNFIDNLQDVEKGQYLIGDTVFMNDRGYQAFKEALLARVYGGTVDGQILLKEMISGGSDFSKTFTNAMIEAMPAMARLESAIAAGDLDASYSISGKLATAIIEYQIWRNQSKANRYTLQEMAGQLWGTIPQDIVKMEIFFNNNSTNAKKLADFFIMYANEVTRKTDNIALPGFEDTVALKPAAELLDGLLDTVNAAGQTAVIADMSNSNLSQMVNNGYDGWEGRLQTFIEPVLQKFLTDMKDPTIPPDWSNVEGLYSGSRKSYSAIRKTIKQIFSNDPKVNKDMRTLILTQAHNKLLAESVAYRTYNGIEGTPAADAFMVQNAISKLSAAASAEGTQVEKFNAIKDPLQNAFDLLDDLKSRSGDPQSIADLEKAVSGSRVEQLGDTDIIESVPLFETQAPAAEGKLPSDVINDLYELDYGTLDILGMTPEMAADIINNKTLNDDPFRVSFIDRLHRLGYSDKDIADMKAAGDTDYAYIIENGIRKGSPDVKTLTKPSDVQDALYHLGYDKIEIESMTYEEAVDIAKNNIENPTPLDISLQNKLHLLGYTDQDRVDMRLTGARAAYIVENQIRKGDPGSEPTPPPPAPGQGGLFGQPDELSYQPGDPLPSVTSDPPQGALAVDQASALTQLNNNDIMGLVDEVTSELETYMRNNTTFDMKDTIPQAAFDALKKQTTVWDGELGSKKLGAMDFAKLSRDHSLLNYTQRRGIDGLMGHVFPYHYWYTTSVTEWAKHLIGAPMIGSAWSKYEELRRRNGMLGFPTRMEGKFWIPAPWLPDYLGDEIFSSPQSRLMPLESIMQPVSLYSDLSETMTKNTIYKINDMVRKGIISPAQAAASIQSGGDQIWQDALAEAILEDDGALSDSVTLASQLMGVAPWWQYSYYFATGQKDKISVLPPTKIGQALSSFRSSDEPGAPSNLGTLIGDILATAGNVIKYPGETMRDLAGMSPYGEPGDYYVRLMLASMLGDGYTSDVAEVERQMIERQGNYWEEAKRRADVYLSVRLPGSMFLHQIQEFAQNPSAENASGIPQAFFLTMFPAGMIPQGEQALRDIAPIYQEAWKKYNMGDKEALNRFEEQYPEYRIRRNMFKDNETLLKGFLVDQIWDKYTSIPKASRQLAVQSLGDNFQSLFLEGKAYDRIDDETLAAWSYSLGGMVPQTEQTAGAVESNQVPVPRYTPEVEAAVTEFQAQRDEMFPDYYWQQQIYWDTAEGKREGLKRQMPSYFRYLTWRNNYYDQNPIVKQWADDQSARRDGGDDRLLSPVGDTLGGSNASIPSNSVLIEFDNTLKAELGKYIINGTPLSSGAKAELTRLWTAKGKPGGSLEQWINAVLGLRR